MQAKFTISGFHADEILEKGIAMGTGFTKLNGFCKYPLWRFSEEFLKAVDKKVYQQYSDEFEECTKPPEHDEEATMEM